MLSEYAMEPFTVRLPNDELGELDQRVDEDDHFDDRSQAVRYAIRQFLQRENIDK